MLQLVHHALCQHSTAKFALLPKAETKYEAEITIVKQQMLRYPINSHAVCSPSLAILTAQEDNSTICLVHGQHAFMCEHICKAPDLLKKTEQPAYLL